MNILKILFCNIEEFYRVNNNILIKEDGIRPSKSLPRNIFDAIDKFKKHYVEKKLLQITKEQISNEILKIETTTDTFATNLRLMRELQFLTVNGDICEYTDRFIRFVNSKMKIEDYFVEKFEHISGIDDMNMLFNSVLCVLREGYIYDRIYGYPDGKTQFMEIVKDKKDRIAHCERVYNIYGFVGRNGDLSQGDYTPNANYRVLTILLHLGWIKRIDDNKLKVYNLTDKGLLVLKKIDYNLQKKLECKKNNKENSNIKLPYNCIFFGAPGTGKSHRINEDRGIFQDRYERVTFHPNYSYGQFVGTYKPVPSKDKEGKDSITYTYVPGPFMRTYVKAIKAKQNDNKPYLLIIEEINRANVAAVFGDVFQLLDRKNGESEYSIETSEDIRKYLALELFHKEYDDCLDDQKEQCNSMKIPSNMYIWATMNSADQGVYPMDTAFKRRWSFEYIGINDEQKDMDMVNVLLPSNENKQQQVNWNSLRKAINSKLLDNSMQKINEDKLLGPYFLSNEIIKEKTKDPEHMVVDNDRFLKEFKSKVLMYLYEDVCKQHKNVIFNDKGHNIKTYSSICETFDNEGLAVFTDDIAKRVKVKEITKLEAKETESEKQQTESPENR